MYTEYNTLILSLGQSLPAQAVIGSGLSYLTGRISYVFGYSGAKRWYVAGGSLAADLPC